MEVFFPFFTWVPPSIQHSLLVSLSQSGVKRNLIPSQAPSRLSAFTARMVRTTYGNMAENQMICSEKVGKKEPGL